MNLSEFLLNDFKIYQKNTAFFIGNGLNNYCGTTSSWKNLLIELAIQHIGKKDDFEKILEENKITYPEFFDLVQLKSNETEETFDYKSIKKNFKTGFAKWTPQKLHSIWVKKIKQLRRPLLTTNFDLLFELSDQKIVDYIKRNVTTNLNNKKLFRPLRAKKNRGGFAHQYPWHCYYSHKKIKDIHQEFGIWHIHGIAEYHASIRLGLMDYMKLVSKADVWLHKSNGNPFHKRVEIDKWVGKNSWLDIFLNNHLLLIGISLESNETFLRWLILEREKLFKKHKALRKKTWYVLNNKREKLSLGKRLFFEKLNIEIIEAKDDKQIWEVTPKRLRKIK